MTNIELTPEDAEQVRALTDELLGMAGDALAPLLSPAPHLTAA